MLKCEYLHNRMQQEAKAEKHEKLTYPLVKSNSKDFFILSAHAYQLSHSLSILSWISRILTNENNSQH